MAPSLRDIPGSNRPRKRFAGSRQRDLWAPPRSSGLDLTPRGLRLDRSRRFRRRPRVDLGILAIAVAALGVLLWMGTSFWSATRVNVEIEGLRDGDALRPGAAEALDISIRVADSDDRFRAVVSVDGIDVLDDLGFTGDTVRIRPAELVSSKLVEGALEEGTHTIALSVGRLFLPDADFRWVYTVDSVAPELRLPEDVAPVPIDEPTTVRGKVEPDALLRMNGEEVEVEGGRFAVTFEHPPTGTLRFEATDPAGNWTVAETVVRVHYPTSSRAVHVSAAGWADTELRAGVLALIEERRIDTVQLDLKDESGAIGYLSEVPMAKRIGAVRAQFDLAEAVRMLESRGVRVIGRLVAFRDPIYAKWAWSVGRKDEVLQTPDGEMLSAYGGFANYVHPTVQKYNLDLALEAVRFGVHDILWDYIRRPEGAPDTMVVPGLRGASADVVVRFLDRSHQALRELGVYQGASVFGIAARSGDSIAQDVPAMARVVDYLAPMIYPSHWGPGQYGVARPIREPQEITLRSLADFQLVTAGSGVHLLPWIQDFTLYGVTYGAAEVRAQIDAAASLGLEGFLLWNPNVRYTGSALTPIV